MYPSTNQAPFSLTEVTKVTYTDVNSDGVYSITSTNTIDSVTSVGTFGAGLLNGVVNKQWGTMNFDVHKETVKHILANGSNWEAHLDSTFKSAYEGLISSINSNKTGALIASALNDTDYGRLRCNDSLDETDLQSLQGRLISAFRTGDKLCIKCDMAYALDAYAAGNGKGTSTAAVSSDTETVLIVIELKE